VTIEIPNLTDAYSVGPDQFFGVINGGGLVPAGQTQTALVYARIQRDAGGNAVRVDYRLLETVAAPDLRGHGIHPLPGTPPRVASVRGLGPDFVANVYDVDGRRLDHEPDWASPSPPRRLLPDIARSIRLIRIAADRSWMVAQDDQHEFYRAGPTRASSRAWVLETRFWLPIRGRSWSSITTACSR
jgi:hypothetical protein